MIGFCVTLYNDKRIRCIVNYEGKSMIKVHSIVAINYFKTVIIKSGHKKWVIRNGSQLTHIIENCPGEITQHTVNNMNI